MTERGSTSIGDLQLGSLIAVAILIELICAVKPYHLFVALLQGLSSVLHKGNSLRKIIIVIPGTVHAIFLLEGPGPGSS